jgi:hypothetical protein
LKKCTDDKNEYRDSQRFFHRQRARTGDQKLRGKQWRKEGNDCSRIDQPSKTDGYRKRYPQTFAPNVSAILVLQKVRVS